jgi:hypothetical protein
MASILTDVFMYVHEKDIWFACCAVMSSCLPDASAMRTLTFLALTTLFYVFDGIRTGVRNVESGSGR